jgi:protein gp37
MGDGTQISWADATWNAATGCDRVSRECDDCYMFPVADRLQRMGNPSYVNGSIYTEHPHMLDLPRRWKTPRWIFNNSMTDTFHERATKSHVFAQLDVMAEVDRHVYMTLTKRPGPMVSWTRQWCEARGRISLPDQVWLGVSVGEQAAAWRLDYLRRAPAVTRFVSVEPLLEPVTLDLAGVDWVIVGGESEQRIARRPPIRMDPDWARSVVAQADALGIPVWVKQLGTLLARDYRLRHPRGEDWDEWPSHLADLRRRERPARPGARAKEA